MYFVFHGLYVMEDSQRQILLKWLCLPNCSLYNVWETIPTMEGDRSYALLYVKDGIHVRIKENSACSRINLKTNRLFHKV